jgi:hypothetical protein
MGASVWVVKERDDYANFEVSESGDQIPRKVSVFFGRQIAEFRATAGRGQRVD